MSCRDDGLCFQLNWLLKNNTQGSGYLEQQLRTNDMWLLYLGKGCIIFCFSLLITPHFSLHKHIQ